VPVLIATALPLLVVTFSPDQESLMDLYAIGVVGAITVNLGSCVFNKSLNLAWNERAVMVLTALVLLAVELTLAKTKPNALYFIVCILLSGFALRAFAQHRAAQAAERPEAPSMPLAQSQTVSSLKPPPKIQAILVAARGITRVLQFALEEARFRGATLYVLFVRVLAVAMPGPAQQPERRRWQDDRAAAEIMQAMLGLGAGAGVRVIPVYIVSEDVTGSILDLSATLGVDMLVLGAPQRSALAALLRGDVVTEVAKNLPDTIELLIHG
jgi:nucleotide-binding universal stress UspA family protein